MLLDIIFSTTSANYQDARKGMAENKGINRSVIVLLICTSTISAAKEGGGETWIIRV
jgi:hypothetical protein